MYISHARMHSPPLPPPYTHNSWRRRSNSVTTLVHNLRRYQNSMSKETCLYEKRHDKETYIWHERTTCWGMKNVCQKRWIYMKRAMIKRPTYDISAQFAGAWKRYVKRDWYIYDKRPNTESYISKKDLYTWKETWSKISLMKCQDKMSKEIWAYEKRPITETYAYDMSHMCDMCDRRRNSTHSLICQKRPVYLERDLIQGPMRMTCLARATCVTEEELMHDISVHVAVVCEQYAKTDLYIWNET